MRGSCRCVTNSPSSSTTIQARSNSRPVSVSSASGSSTPGARLDGVHEQARDGGLEIEICHGGSSDGGSIVLAPGIPPMAGFPHGVGRGSLLLQCRDGPPPRSLYPRRRHRRPHAGPAARARTRARGAGGAARRRRAGRCPRLCAQRRLARAAGLAARPGPRASAPRRCARWWSTATRAAACSSAPRARRSRRWHGSSTCRRSRSSWPTRCASSPRSRW